VVALVRPRYKSIAKAGLLMHARSAAIEFAPLGIRVNALAPGAIETDMNRKSIESIGREKFNQWIPAGRVGTAEELVDAFLFLAGPASTYTTGARLCVDGGYEHHVVRYGKED
jgi:NAD(P)-dependent dehydrogenase (short-subunit alcohol dehydrogenase family)